MTVKLVTAATQEPVSLEELKSHLKIDGDDENQDLKLKLRSARRYVEKAALNRRALITSSWSLALESWPTKSGYIEVPLGNLQSAGPIVYRLSNGTESTFTEFRLARTYTPANPAATPPATGDGDTDAGIGRIYLGYLKYWPLSILDVGEPIAIPFTCGWTDAAAVPSDIKLAILMVAAHWYRNREAVSVGTRLASATGESEAIPMISTKMALAVDALCAPYADTRF